MPIYPNLIRDKAALLARIYEAFIKGEVINHYIDEDAFEKPLSSPGILTISKRDRTFFPDLERNLIVFAHKLDRKTRKLPVTLTPTQAAKLVHDYWEDRIEDD